MVRFKRRLKNLGIKTIEKYYLYRTTGKPCSCSMCSTYKYKRTIKHKNNNEHIKEYWYEMSRYFEINTDMKI